MENKTLRKEIEEIIAQQKDNENKLQILAYKLWQSEQGTPPQNIGYKAILRELGFVI